MPMSRLFDSGRRVVPKGRLFSFGDSLSTIRKAPQAGVSTNGRFSTNGWNWCDYFRFGFHPFLEFSTATSWAYEGAYAVQDISGFAWSIVQPIPGFNGQITTMMAEHPAGSINESDVAAIYFGTNDSNNWASLNPAPTATTVSDAIVAGVNRLIAYGFVNFIILLPETRYLGGGVPAILLPQLTAIGQANRAVRIATVHTSNAINTLATPIIPDGTHYFPETHERLGEAAISQFLNQSFVSGAWGNAANPNDPCLALQSTSLSNQAVLRLDALAGSTAGPQSPFLLMRAGNVPRIRIDNDGASYTILPATSTKALSIAFGDTERFSVTPSVVSLNCSGSTESSPSIFGLTGLGVDAVGEFWLGDTNNSLGVKFGTGVRLRSYNGIDIFGNSQGAPNATPYTSSTAYALQVNGSSSLANTTVLRLRARSATPGAFLEAQNSAGTQVAAISANGSFFVGSNQVVTARQTGFAAGSFLSGIAGSKSVANPTTIAQLATAVKAMYDALKIHGLVD